MRHNVLFVITCFCLGFGALAHANPPPSKAVLVLVDVSDSTPKLRNDFRASFEKVLMSVREGDRLYIGTVEKGATTKSHERFNKEFPAKGFMESDIKYGPMTRQFRKAARSAFGKAIEEISDETPILDTIEEARRLFANFKNPRKILVLLSDMKEYSRGGLNFEAKKAVLSKESVGRLLTDLKNNGRIPNLRAVKVYVAGAGDDEPQRARNVRDFWNRYFSETGADFSLDRYGTSLVAFPE